jgi:hypothetical protein
VPLAVPTLAITDAADGTGGTAAITGGDAGATNVVSHAIFTGTPGSLTWVLSGSRVGNGSVAVAPGNGYYLWRVLSSLGGESVVSNLVYQNLTDATQALHYRCLLAVQARIRGLSLTGIASANVRVLKLPRYLRDKDSLPGVAVCPVGKDPNLGGTNERDDIGYPVLVTTVSAGDQDLETNLPRNLLWRQKIQRALRNQHLAGVPSSEIWIVKPEPLEILDPTLFFEKDLEYSAMLFRCISRETRG